MLLDQHSQGFLVFSNPINVFVCHFRNTTGVQVVSKIGYLHGSGQGIDLDPFDEIFLGLVAPARQTINSS